MNILLITVLILAIVFVATLMFTTSQSVYRKILGGALGVALFVWAIKLIAT